MRFLIGIMTCHRLDYKLNDLSQDYLEQRGLRCMDIDARRSAIRDTWAKDLADFYAIDNGVNVTYAEYKFFFGANLANPADKPNQRVTHPLMPRPALDALLRQGSPFEDEIYLPCGDLYKDNTAKLREMCRYALDRGFDFLMKVDDDTFVYPDRLMSLDWSGYDYSGALNPNWPFHPGGAVIMSRRAMQSFLQYPSNHHADDYVLGVAMERVGIKPHALNFRIEFGDNYLIQPPSLGDHTYAALHSCSPNVIRELGKVNEQPNRGDGV